MPGFVLAMTNQGENQVVVLTLHIVDLLVVVGFAALVPGLAVEVLPGTLIPDVAVVTGIDLVGDDREPGDRPAGFSGN